MLLGGFVFFNFPFLFEKEIYSQEISLDEGKIIIISDLHLDSNSRDLSCIGNYLKENDIPYLIINGDLFDKLHKERFREELLEEAKGKLAIREGSPENIIYILALYNHDPYLEVKTKEFQEDDKETVVLRGILKLRAQEQLFYIFHGDYAISNTIGIAAFVNKLTSNLFFERFAKKVLRAEKEAWVILGHSHIPGIDYENKVANSGCWINRIIPNTDTAILIDIGELGTRVNLIKIPCEQ